MARVSTTKTRQVRVVLGPVLLEGLVPDPIAMYKADGTPIDPSSLGEELPPIPSWAGVWDSEVVYEPYAIVRYNSGISEGLWFTAEGVDLGVQPDIGPGWDLMLEVPIISIPDIPTWYGAWDLEAEYPPKAQVTYSNALWVTDGGATAGFEPGVETDGYWQLMLQGVA